VPLHKLDDWDDGIPDSWDYTAVLFDYKATVKFDVEFGWSLSWEHGVMGIRLTYSESDLAYRAAALFIELWLRGVSASFADKLMDAYIMREREIELQGMGRRNPSTPKGTTDEA
jgi:hypothetical protein